jgi:cytochrome c6
MKKKLININYCIFALILLSFQNIKADDIFDQGKQIFLGDGNCVSCHTLQDANSNGNIGPNLDEIKPDIAKVLYAVTNGIGVMPAYEGQLTTEEIKAVAIYIVKSTN